VWVIQDRVLCVFYPFLVEGMYCVGTGLMGSETYFESTGMAVSIFRKFLGWKLWQVAGVGIVPKVCLFGLGAKLCRVEGVKTTPGIF
jgi:hypothetical protein